MMAITPADIEQLTFSPSKHGYDTEEVDTFLEQLSAEVDGMLQKIADLKGRLNAADSQLQTSQAQVASLKQQVSELEAEAARPAPAPVQAGPSAEYLASERQISQVLIVAQQSADKLVADAHDNADRIRNEADQKALIGSWSVTPPTFPPWRGASSEAGCPKATRRRSPPMCFLSYGKHETDCGRKR